MEETSERYYDCPVCGGTGKVQVPLTKDDMEEMGLTELYYICPECNGNGMVEFEGVDPDMAYDQRNEI